MTKPIAPIAVEILFFVYFRESIRTKPDEKKDCSGKREIAPDKILNNCWISAKSIKKSTENGGFGLI